MKNACESQNDNGQFQEKCDVVLPTLEVWRLGFDCKCFLDMSGRQWKACCALKRALGMKSVFNFLPKICNLVLPFLSSFRVC